MINIKELIDDYQAEGYTYDLAVQMAKEELSRRVATSKKRGAQYHARLPHERPEDNSYVGDGQLPIHYLRPRRAVKVGKKRLIRVRKQMS